MGVSLDLKITSLLLCVCAGLFLLTGCGKQSEKTVQSAVETTVSKKTKVKRHSWKCRKKYTFENRNALRGVGYGAASVGSLLVAGKIAIIPLELSILSLAGATGIIAATVGAAIFAPIFLIGSGYLGYKSVVAFRGERVERKE